MGQWDIPKYYTALAEWLSCFLFIIILDNRWKKWITALILAVFLAVFVLLHYGIGIWPLVFWIPAMIGAMALIFLCIWLCCDISASEAVFRFAVAFMLAEFIASFEWQIETFFMARTDYSQAVKYVLLIVIYGAIFLILFLMGKRFFLTDREIQYTWKEAFSTTLMVLAVFLTSNTSYVFPNTPFSTELPRGIVYIRALIDFSGVLAVFILQAKWRDFYMRQEVDAANRLMQRQYEQYQMSRESIEIINRKYHDLKHQITAVRAEGNSEKREQYLKELEEGLQGYGVQNKTGNHVLDTILTGKHLYCKQRNIQFMAAVDGTLLDFMNVMDLCAIFGNALDNAIECEEKIPDAGKRMVRVSVGAKEQFIIIRVENYWEEELRMKGNLPVTTKKDTNYHGYGLKSIRSTAEKYGGHMTLRQEDRWVQVRIMIPLPQKAGTDFN